MLAEIIPKFVIKTLESNSFLSLALKILPLNFTVPNQSSPSQILNQTLLKIPLNSSFVIKKPLFGFEKFKTTFFNFRESLENFISFMPTALKIVSLSSFIKEFLMPNLRLKITKIYIKNKNKSGVTLELIVGFSTSLKTPNKKN